MSKPCLMRLIDKHLIITLLSSYWTRACTAQPGSEGGSCQPEGGHRGTERDLGKDAKCNPSSSGGPEKAGIWCQANQGEKESVQTIQEA